MGLLQYVLTWGRVLKDINILIVDDNEFVRRAICNILRSEPMFRVVCEVADGAEGIQKSKELQPAVVLLDVSMPGMGGFEAAGQILAVSPKSEIVLLTQHAVARMAQAAFANGIRGYVVKSDAATDLVPAVRAAIEHRQFASLGLALGEE